MSAWMQVSLGTLLCFTLFAVRGAAEEVTEQEALQLLEKNPRFRALHAGVPVAAVAARVRTRPPNPSFNFTYEGAGRTELYQVGQELPVNGRQGILKQAGESLVAVAEARSAEAFRGLQAEMRSAFHALLVAQTRETTLEKSIAELEELAAILRAREREGEGSRFDLLRAEQEIVERSTDLASARVEIARRQIWLASYLRPGINARELRASGELSPGGAPPPVDELLAKALSSRADYQVEVQELQRLALEEQAAERRRIPNPVVIGGLKRADNLGPRLENGPVLGVSVNLPLFNPGKAESDLARAEAERSRARQAALAIEITAEVQAAYESLRLRREVLEEYQRQVEDKSYALRDIAEESYREGEAGILELLDSYRVAQQSRQRLLELMYAARLARIELDRAVGAEVSR
jgi:outer membrane protein TolC